MLSRNTWWCDLRIAVGISVLAIFLLAGAAWAQPHEEWNMTFGGKTDDFASSVAQTSDGGYVIAGTTNSDDYGIGDAWLIKVSSEPDRLAVVSTNILPGLSYQVLPKKMHSISPVFLVVSTVFYWLSQF